MIRDADARDTDVLERLERACFPDEPWSRRMVEDELVRPGGIVVVADAPDGVVGSAMGWFVLDELHVLRVAVFGAHRGAGIGRALVRALHARATGADAAWLEVRRDNAPAIAMYASLGYAPIAVRPRYYTDGCDALVLRLDRPGTTGAA